MVGIPSVYRKNGFKYLTEAVSSLLIYFSTSQIIVFNADEKKTMPPKWIKDVHVIHRKNKLTIDTQYPLPEHHDAQTIQAATDNDMRKIWRMKEALDYIYIAEYMIQFKSNWTVIVQDDAVMNDFSFLKKTFPSKIFSLWGRDKRETKCHKTHCGMVAFVFHTETLIDFIAYVKKRYKYKPIDWLFNDFTELYNIDVPIVHAVRHIGGISSLKGQYRTGDI